MPLSSEEAKLGYELNQKVKAGFRKTVFYIVYWFVFSTLISPILMVAENFSNLQQAAFVSFALIWFSGSGYLFYKMISAFKKSIMCPRCNQPYNVGSFGNVPFTKKCQNCGLQMVSTQPQIPDRANKIQKI